MEALILFFMVLGLLFVGLPVGVALGLSSILFITFFSNDSLSSIAISLFGAGNHYTLLAIPFFIIASAFMSTGGVAKRLINFAIASVGHFRGGLAMASVLACMMFAALSGSSPATVVAIGTIAIAGMRQVGYSKEFASGIIANAGTLGILIPPSIVMVVYAASTDVSVGRMFLAGVIPGLVAGLMLMLAIYVVARIKNLPSEEWKGFGAIVRGGKEAGWGLFLIVIIMGGIYGGAFTPTEAAVVAAVYSIIVALFVYRDMGPLKGIPWVTESDSAHAKVGFNGSVYGVSIFMVFMILSFFATSDPENTSTAGDRAIWGLALSAVVTIFYIIKRSGHVNESFAKCFVAGLAIWKRNFVLLVKGFFPALFGEETRKTMLEGTKTTVMLMFIIANALLFAHTLSAERIPQMVTEWMLDVGFYLVVVPDRSQHSAIDWWSVHGAIGSSCNRSTSRIPNRDGAWNRPYSPRYHHGCEHGDRYDYPSNRFEPVCNFRHNRHEFIKRSKSSCAICCGSVCLPNSSDLHTCTINLAAIQHHGTRDYYQVIRYRQKRLRLERDGAFFISLNF